MSREFKQSDKFNNDDANQICSFTFIFLQGPTGEAGLGGLPGENGPRGVTVSVTGELEI